MSVLNVYQKEYNPLDGRLDEKVDTDSRGRSAFLVSLNELITCSLVEGNVRS